MIEPHLDHKRAVITKEVTKRGLVLQEFGKGWRVVGNDVDILIDDLANLDTRTLEPAR